jgi:inosine-uridine nucleoside N-ribohydrolase
VVLMGGSYDDGTVDRPRNSLVATEIDGDGFWNLVINALARLPLD